MEEEDEGEVEEVEDGEGSIWAFCLRTSAGVRIRHETSSATEEERAWIMGEGRGADEALRRDFEAS